MVLNDLRAGSLSFQHSQPNLFAQYHDPMEHCGRQNTVRQHGGLHGWARSPSEAMTLMYTADTDTPNSRRSAAYEIAPPYLREV